MSEFYARKIFFLILGRGSCAPSPHCLLRIPFRYPSNMLIVDPGYMTSLMTSSRNNVCRDFGANYLGNETRLDLGVAEF